MLPSVQFAGQLRRNYYLRSSKSVRIRNNHTIKVNGFHQTRKNQHGSKLNNADHKCKQYTNGKIGNSNSQSQPTPWHTNGGRSLPVKSKPDTVTTQQRKVGRKPSGISRGRRPVEPLRAIKTRLRRRGAVNGR